MSFHSFHSFHQPAVTPLSICQLDQHRTSERTVSIVRKERLELTDASHIHHATLLMVISQECLKRVIAEWL